MIDIALRLVVAVIVGMIVGLNRDLKGKPTGARTLGLVSLGAALVSVATTAHQDINQHPDAYSRVVQGVIQGVMAGVGFIGAGVILRDLKHQEIQNLTSAASVWVTAALGIACAMAAWYIIWLGVGLTLFTIIFGGLLERLLRSVLRRASPERDAEHEDQH